MKKSKIVILILVLVAMLTSVSLYFAKVVRAIAVEGEDTYPTETYCINMIINELDRKTQTNLAGNKIKIAESSQGLVIDTLDVTTNETLEKNEDGSITVPEEGIKLKIDKINASTTYDVVIESVDTADYYTPTFKQVTIAIEAQEDGQISAYVKQIKKDVDGKEVTTQGSEQNTAIFMYEDENHKIKIKNNENVKIFYVKAGKNGLTKEELEKEQWTEYTKDSEIEVEENGIIYAKSQYKDESFSEINEIYITNIDKINPTVTAGEIKLLDSKEEATVALEMKDGEATEQYGKSGIYGYAITESEEQPEDFIECSEYIQPGVAYEEDTEPVTIDAEGITSNGTYYAWVQDNAGNVAHISFEVTQIQEKKKVVAIILDCPVKELEGKEFNSLEELLKALDENNITKESGKVVVQIVDDIQNESIKIENKDIEIDLNGYTIESKLQEPTIKVESGKLKVVDEKYDIEKYIEDEELKTQLSNKYHSKKSEDGTPVNGEIINKNYIGIEIYEHASLEVGIDNTTIGSVEIPNTETPKIYGGKKGIYNHNGNFGFYDGQIYGEVPVEGKITDTPVLFDPTVEQSEEGIKKSILQRVSEVEALIGKTRYTKLENAIAAAKDTDKATEIDIVTAIARTESIEVDNTKNIIIDLNGYGITNMGTDDSYAFINSGKMEIKDSVEEASEDKAQAKGIVKSSAYKVIDNKDGAEFKLTSGTIECTISSNSSRAYLINNEDNGKVTLKGGTLRILNSSSSSQAYAVYNGDNGNVLLDGTTIDIQKDSYAIYNAGAGTVTVDRGSITGLQYQNSYGIYNANAGTITVNNVTIKCVTYGIYNDGTGTITVNAGKISGTKVIYNKNNGDVLIKGGTISTNASEYGGGSQTIVNAGAGTITIENGTLSGTYEVITNDGAGDIVVKGGTLTSTGGNYYVILNNNTGNVTVEGGTLNGNCGINNKKDGTVIVKNNVQINLSGYNCIGINNVGTVSLESGTININPTGSNKTYGIYNNASGTVTLGINGEDITSETTPSITGGTSGIFNNGIFNFYDGKIQGSIYAITGSVQTVQEGYDIILSKENGEEAILGNQNGIAYIGEDTQKLYDNLQEAIDECEDGQTITLVKDVTIIDTQKMTVKENQNIKLDLNGNEIRSFIKEETILNNGTLTITDSSEELEGKILAYSKNIIRNTKDFILEKGQLIVEAIYKEVSVVYSESGTVTIKDGLLSTTTDTNNSYGNLVYGINNKGAGNVTVESGTIFIQGYKPYGIYNESTGTITFKNGTINFKGTTDQYGIYNKTTGNIIIEDGEIISSYGLYIEGAGKITLNGGTIKYSYCGIYNKVEGTIIVNDGSIQNNGYGNNGIDNNGSGTVTLTGGSITSSRNGINNNSTGTVTIEGGTITSSTGINNNSTGTVTVKNGTINGSSRGINNSSKGTIIVKGGTIIANDSTSYGIYNNSTGTVTVEEGTITATGRTSYGVYNNNLNGTIIVGVDESDVPSTTNPSISGQTNGIYNNGIFNFYDGVIKGPIKNSIQGVVSTWAKGYNVIKYASGEYDGVEEGKEISILVKQNIAHLESTNKDYFSLEDAIKEARANEQDNIKLLQDISISDDMESIEFNKDIVLDLYGHSIYTNKESAIINTNKLEIIDSKETGKLEGNASGIISNNKDAILVIKKVLLNQKQAESNCISNNGTLTIEGATLNAISSKSTVISNQSKGTVTIKEGTLTATASSSYGITNEGTVKVEGGEINATGYKSYGISNEGNLTVNGGTIKGDSIGINNNSTGTVTVTSGTIKGDYGISNYNTGTVTVKGGIITESNSGIYNGDTGKVFVEGGEIVTDNWSTSYGINNQGTGTVNVTGGTITVKGNYSYGIYNNNSGIINITGGTINSIGNYSYGIYNNNSGTIIVGQKEETPNMATLDISAGIYGVYNNGIFNFYDGKIKGTKYAIVGTVNEIKDGYDIILSNQENKEQATLEKQSGIAYIGDSQSTYYDDLQEAINACEAEQTITLLKDITIMATQEITIDENKNITINLNGKEIRTYAKENTILNNGTLTITDNNEEVAGKILGYSKNIIKNTNKFILEKGEIISESLKDDAYVIYNEQGNITLEGGSIKALSGRNRYGIYNKSEGTITVNGGTINITATTNSYGIYNEGNGSIKLIGGEITTSGNHSYGIYNKLEGTVTIENGTINTTRINSGSTYGIYNEQNGTVTVTGGTISATEMSSYGIYNNGTGTVTIQNGTISGYYGLHNQSTGYIIVNNGNITGTYHGIDNTGTITINDVTITVTGASSSGIYNYNGGNITVLGGTISATGAGSSGIYNYNGGNITVLGGTISATGENSYGINNSINRGTVTLGENDERTPNTITPIISGGAYGINNTGDFYFYDGIIKGDTIAINGKVSETPKDYGVKYQDLLKTAILGVIADFENSIFVNGIYYDSLETAVDVISKTTSKTGTIHICDSIDRLGTSLTIPEDVNITIALEGHTISYDNVEVAITNNGTLTIIDYENIEDGDENTLSKITNSTGTVIQNNGKLTIGKTGSKNTESPVIEGKKAVDGTEATIINGKTVDLTETVNLDENVSKIIERLKVGTQVKATKNVLMSSNSGLSGETKKKPAMSDLPEMIQYPYEWTNDKVYVYMNADVIPVLNLYMAEGASYTVEYYKGETDDPTDVEKEKTKEPNETIQVKKDNINKNKYEGYKVSKIVVEQPENENTEITVGEEGIDAAINKIPETVKDDTKIKVYYVIDETQRHDITYKIEYYLQNDETANYTDTKTQSVQLLTTEVAIDTNSIESKIQSYNGYKLSRITLNDSGEYTSIDQLQDKKVSNNQVIKVYLIVNEESKHDIQYTVEYYLSEQTSPEHTDIETQNVQALITKLDINTENINKKIAEYAGYKLSKITIDEQNYTSVEQLQNQKIEQNKIIKVYLVIDFEQTHEIKYTVEYYLKDINNAEETKEVKENVQLLQTQLNVQKEEIRSKTFNGYKFSNAKINNQTYDSIDSLPEKVSDKTVIKVYYVIDENQRDDISYTVEFYKDETEKVDSFDKTESIQILEERKLEINKTEITERYTQEQYKGKYIGYKLEKIQINEQRYEDVNSLPEKVDNGTTIKVYFEIDPNQKHNISYTLEYYKGESDENPTKETVTEQVQVLENELTLQEIDRNKFDGYKLSKVVISDQEYPDGSNLPGKVEDTTIVKVYYEIDPDQKHDITYTIEYYLIGTKDNNATQTKTQEVQKLITEVNIDKEQISSKVKEYIGYKLSKITINDKGNYTSVEDLNDKKVQDQAIIKVYLVVDDEQTKTLTYTVQFYKDNDLQTQDTIEKTEVVQVLHDDTIEVDKQQIVIDSKYEGYRLLNITKTEREGQEEAIEEIPSQVQNGTIIKVNYTKRTDLQYTIEYYYNNEKDSELTYTEQNQTYGAIITREMITDKIEKNKKQGYRVATTEEVENSENGVIGTPLQIGINADSNIIKVYYVIDEEQRDNITYTVEFYKNETEKIDSFNKTESIQILQERKLTVDKEEITQRYTEEQYKEKYVGYKLVRIQINEQTYNDVKSLPEKVDNGTTIKVYFEIDPDQKHNISYIVEYYLTDIKDEAATQTKTQEVQKLITEVNIDKESITSKIQEYVGYKLSKITINDNGDYTSVESLNDTKVSNNDVIKVYLVIDDSVKKTLSYSIQYYKDGKQETADTYTEQKEVQWLQSNTIEVNKEKIETSKYLGYKLENITITYPGSTETQIEKENIPVSVDSGTIIKVYYVINDEDTRQLSYTVKYFKGKLDTNPEIEIVTANVQILKETIPVQPIAQNKYEGYIIEKIEVDEPDESTKTLTNVSQLPKEVKDKSEIRVYYVGVDATITIRYVDRNMNQIKPDVTVNGIAYDEYDLSSHEIQIPDYTLIESPVPLKVVFKPTPQTFMFVYGKNTKIVENHIDKNTSNVLKTKEIPGIVGDVYTATADNFEGYVLVEKPQQETVTFTEEVIVLNYYYVHISSGVIEKHIDIVSNDLLDSTLYEGNEGDPYTTSSKVFNGYDLVQERMPQNAEGIMTKDIIEVDYYYIKKTSVKAEYIDKITKQNLLEENGQDSTVYLYGHEQDPYETKEKTFKNYVIVQDMYPQNTKGNMTKEEIVVKYYYVHVSSGVVERHIDEKTGELIEPETRYTGNEGDPYKTSPKEFEGYELVQEKIPQNAEGTMTKEEIVVNYYYEKKSEPEKEKTQVVVEYIDKVTGQTLLENGQDSTEHIYGKEGDAYKTKEKNFEGYDIIKEMYPTNVEGTMTKDIIEVKYYYVRKVKLTIHHIENGTEKQLEEDEINVVHEGENYKTDSKNIKDYDVVKDKMPANKEGVVGKEDIEVTYYYEKKKEPTPDIPKEPDKPDPMPIPTPTPDPTPTPTPQPEPPKVVLPAVPQTQGPSNTVTKQNTSNANLPNTGDNTPLVTISVIILVVLINLIQIITSKTGKKGKHYKKFIK